ncbi:hypothetical protein OsI_38659 [Oryza sativa Indica Group]|uniref:Uncharacterized protein n=1 Tax=Oryza sativa subsp. indica TaxID=39946 RepID=A2ZLG3_ORYSI|nr:hypothetical protein OsI_38659 [Oryza sativa Indica Group]
MASFPPSRAPLSPPLDEREELLGTSNDDHEGRGFSWLTAMGFACLTINSGMAVYRSQGDAGSIAFVTCSYVDLVLLFWVLRRFDGAAVSLQSRRKRVLVTVWVLSGLLAVLFGWKVATVMPLPIAAVVWAMAVTAMAGLSWAFSFFGEEPPSAAEMESWV